MSWTYSAQEFLYRAEKAGLKPARWILSKEVKVLLAKEAGGYVWNEDNTMIDTLMGLPVHSSASSSVGMALIVEELSVIKIYP